mgnify:CR=1 FL=1
MPYDAVKMADWQISEAAEKNMPTPEEWREKLGLEKDEVLPMGRLAKLDFLKIINRLKDKPDGKYIEVTAITPTPLGEGKSTTTMGLLQGMGKRGVKVSAAIRQPSGGPTMNIKGSAAGGGLVHPGRRQDALHRVDGELLDVAPVGDVGGAAEGLTAQRFLVAAAAGGAGGGARGGLAAGQPEPVP